MKILKSLALFLLFSTIISTANGQTIAEVDKLQADHQTCVDKGGNILGCSLSFEKEMAVLVTATYSKLEKALNAADKKSLADDQAHWITERDDFYKYMDNIYNVKIASKEWEPDMQNYILNEKTFFLRDRALPLLRKLQTSQK